MRWATSWENLCGSNTGFEQAGASYNLGKSPKHLQSL